MHGTQEYCLLDVSSVAAQRCLSNSLQQASPLSNKFSRACEIHRKADLQNEEYWKVYLMNRFARSSITNAEHEETWAREQAGRDSKYQETGNREDVPRLKYPILDVDSAPRFFFCSKCFQLSRLPSTLPVATQSPTKGLGSKWYLRNVKRVQGRSS
jgi:hypothetical protein